MQFNAVLVKLLDELEVRLRAAQLWQATPPSSQALVSQEPFAVDTLLPHETGDRPKCGTAWFRAGAVFLRSVAR
ncbi:Domain of uncharacterised function%2C DUF446 [Vibrio cholerae]|nr:Domain of uncharacterised function%2C DUF446 [Vibrio cholerae]